MITLQGLSKRFGRRTVLAPSTFTFSPGFWVLRGPNGCGKSTLLRMLAGMIPPDEGTIRLGAYDLATQRALALAQVAWVPEGAEYPAHFTVRELLELVASLRGIPAEVAHARTTFLPDGLLGLPYGALSLGQRRRVHLALAVSVQPTVLLLDEPTNGLDAQARAQLLAWLPAWRDGVRTIVAATHDDDLTPLADTVVTLHDARLERA